MIPVLIFYHNAFTTKSEYVVYYENDLMFNSLLRLTSIISVFLTTYIVIVKIERKALKTFSLTIDSSAIAKGFFLGLLLFTSFIIVTIATHSVKFSYSQITWRHGFEFFLYLAVAVSEEVVVRGYVLNNMREKYSPIISVILSSVIFGALHLDNDHFTWIGFINISLSGALMAFLVLHTNSISASVGLHWSWNFIQGTVAGFNVSGEMERGIFAVESTSPQFLSGGEFGAEGSLSLIPITLIFICLLRYRQGYLFNKFFPKA